MAMLMIYNYKPTENEKLLVGVYVDDLHYWIKF